MPSAKQSVKTRLSTFYQSIKDEPKHLLGLPGNMLFDSKPIAPFLKLLLNNVGDPFENSNYKLHSKQFEIEVLDFFAKQFGLSNYWGYITNGGTEGNMHGLFAARERFPNGIVYSSQDTHYSIAKLTHILKMECVRIVSQQNGEINYQTLAKNIKKNIDKPVILNLNIGTTFKGAIDSVSKITSLLSRLGVRDFYIHCDAALFGGFISQVIPRESKYWTHFSLPIDSISVSGHKFIGCPMSCGIFLTRKNDNKAIDTKIAYINSSDTTISGSRNGHTALLLWYAVAVKGEVGFKKDGLQCLKNAQYLQKKLHAIGIKSFRNEYSNIVLFKKPSKATCEKWQLSVVDKEAHVVVMPHVSSAMINMFMQDLYKERDACL